MHLATYNANRFREVIFHGTFIANTNYQKELDGLDYIIVNKKISDFNTIAALAQHLHYYISGINKVWEGGTLEIRDQFSFDFPTINSQNQWNEFLEKFWTDAEIFAKHIEKFSNDELQSNFVLPKYGTIQRNIDAMIEHAYYHLGQIVLIKKGIFSFD